MQAAQKGAGFDAALDVWRRRKWLAILAFPGAFAVALSMAAFLPAVYKSTATILVERQQVPEAFVQSTVTSGVDSRLQTITQQVLSRSRLEGLMSRFGLYADLRQRVSLEEVIELMRKDILLELKGQQSKRGDETAIAFSLSYRGSNPQQVAQVTNALASFYIDENLKVREQQAGGTAEFLRIQLEGIRQRLEAQEQLLSQFREHYIGELPEQMPANLAVLERLNTQLTLNSEKQARASGQRASLAQQLAELEALRPPGAAPDTEVGQLEKLRQDLAVLRTRYSENYPDIALLQSEITALERRLAETASPKKSAQVIQPPLRPYVQQLKQEFGTLDIESKLLRTEEQNLLRSIALYHQRVENTPRRELELQGLQRDYDTTKWLYQSLLKRQEEAKLAENLEQRQKGEQFRLLEPALPAERPVAPNRGKLILTGLFISLGLAAGAVVLVEQLDLSFHTVDALRAFSPVPVLVSLPHIVTRAETRRRRWRFGLVGLSAILGLVLIVGSSYVAIKGPAQLTVLYAQLQRLRK